MINVPGKRFPNHSSEKCEGIFIKTRENDFQQSAPLLLPVTCLLEIRNWSGQLPLSTSIEETCSLCLLLRVTRFKFVHKRSITLPSTSFLSQLASCPTAHTWSPSSKEFQVDEVAYLPPTRTTCVCCTKRRQPQLPQ